MQGQGACIAVIWVHCAEWRDPCRSAAQLGAQHARLPCLAPTQVPNPDVEGRRQILAYARQRWPVAALGGAASIGSYTIALWAMTRAPVASVAALRETSVLFATVIGTVMLKERFGLQRALGAVVIVAGVMALRLG